MISFPKGVSFCHVSGFVGLVDFWLFRYFWYNKVESVSVESNIDLSRISLYLRLQHFGFTIAF